MIITRLVIKMIFISLMSTSSFAATINTMGVEGSSMSGWGKARQTVLVSNDDNLFNFFSFYADVEAEGSIFTLSVEDAGASSIFSTSVMVSSGINNIDINQAVLPGSQLSVIIDFNGFTNRSLQYIGHNRYADGKMALAHTYEDHWDNEYNYLDLRFTADFGPTVGTIPLDFDPHVPLPASFVLFLSGFIALIGISKKRKNQY